MSYSVTLIISRRMRWSNDYVQRSLLESLSIKRSRLRHAILLAFIWEHWRKSRNTSVRIQAIPVEQNPDISVKYVHLVAPVRT
jgi:hypothetical protein